MQHPVRLLFHCVATLAWFGAAGPAAADLISLNPVEDATISEKSLDIPLGTNGAQAALTLDAGTTGANEGGKINRSLLRFDVASSVPSNAIVTSATLTMTISSTPPLATNLWFSLHRVLVDWNESAVTWTNRLSPPAAWGAPGGAPAIDYSSAVTQSNLITGVGVFTFASNPGMVADVQDWVSQPASNAGWMLICELESLFKSVRKFTSRENIATNSRPTLVVQFNREISPPTLNLLPATNGQFQFWFNAESNRGYTVIYGDDIGATNWNVLTNIPPRPVEANVLVADALLTESNRFYRVRSP